MTARVAAEEKDIMVKVNPGQSGATDPARQPASITPHVEARRAAAAKRGAGKSDEVVLSEKARMLRAADSAVRASADVREDKVAEVRQKLQDGTYAIDPAVIAERMLEQP